MNLVDIINSIKPAHLARARGRNQATSTRDKLLLIKKVEEIDSILEELGIIIECKCKKK